MFFQGCVYIKSHKNTKFQKEWKSVWCMQPPKEKLLLWASQCPHTYLVIYCRMSTIFFLRERHWGAPHHPPASLLCERIKFWRCLAWFNPISVSYQRCSMSKPHIFGLHFYFLKTDRVGFVRNLLGTVSAPNDCISNGGGLLFFGTQR